MALALALAQERTAEEHGAHLARLQKLESVFSKSGVEAEAANEHYEPSAKRGSFLGGESAADDKDEMAILAQDGITGPMGPSLWEKISRRYREVAPFLKP